VTIFEEASSEALYFNSESTARGDDRAPCLVGMGFHA